jgi:hypothetical protein
LLLLLLLLQVHAVQLLLQLLRRFQNPAQGFPQSLGKPRICDKPHL